MYISACKLWLGWVVVMMVISSDLFFYDDCYPTWAEYL